MEIPVIKIGNSYGIQLSDQILKKYNISSTLEVILEDDRIILKPKIGPREGWDEQFKKMNQLGDDKFLINDVFEDETFD